MSIFSDRIHEMKNVLPRRWNLTIKVIPYVLLILVAKYIIHSSAIEFLTLSSLFTAVISANIFLFGFLISGVLVDYKESEKLPGDLAVSLEALYDECSIIYKNKKAKIAKEFLNYLKDFTESYLKWFYKKEKSWVLMDKISGFNDYFLAFESLTQANFIIRMKQEQNNIRRILTRMHTIRETSFNPTAYTIVEVISILLILGLIFVKIDPFYESIFFIGFVSFILIYMLLLIKDLDNPYGYYMEKRLAEEVSLKPLYDLKNRLEKKL